MKFHLDENVDRAIALGLTRRGIEVTTVDDAGLRGADDATQLGHAFAEQCVLVTNDSDFLRLHRQGIQHAGIAYFADQRKPVGDLIRLLVLLHEVVPTDQMLNRVEFL